MLNLSLMKCIVIDDEPLARLGIQHNLEAFPDLEMVGSFNNATAAADYLQLNPVDLIFLDICMPGTNGLAFAKSIPKNTLVIFVTAHSEYALESYEAEALDYLVKPIEVNRFRRAILKAQHYYSLLQQRAEKLPLHFTQQDFLFVRAERQFFKVEFNQLLFVEGLKDYAILHLPDQKIITASNLKTILRHLPPELFMRVNKSFIVNLSKIKQFDNNTIYLHDTDIPIGNLYRAQFFETLVNKNLLNR